jgi:hypothetical protein
MGKTLTHWKVSGANMKYKWLKSFAVAFALIGITCVFAWCEVQIEREAEITERLKIQQGVKK